MNRREGENKMLVMVIFWVLFYQNIITINSICVIDIHIFIIDVHMCTLHMYEQQGGRLARNVHE